MEQQSTSRRSPIDPRVAHILGQSGFGNLAVLNTLRTKPILEKDRVVEFKNEYFATRLNRITLEKLKELCDELYASMDAHEVKRRINNLFVKYENFPKLPDHQFVSMFLANKNEHTKPSNFLERYVGESFEHWKEENERNFFILLYTALTAPTIIEAKTQEEIESGFNSELYRRSQTVSNNFRTNYPDNQEEYQRVFDECYFGYRRFCDDYLPRVRDAASANDGTLDDVIMQGLMLHDSLLHEITKNAEDRMRARNLPPPPPVQLPPPQVQLPLQLPPKNWLISWFGKPKPGGKKRASTRRRKQKSRRSKKTHKNVKR